MSLTPADLLRLERTQFNLTNHTPTPERIERIEALRDRAKHFAAIVYLNCPESRERALALTKLEEVVMWAVASIAREKWADEEAKTRAEVEEARRHLAEIKGEIEGGDAPTT